MICHSCSSADLRSAGRQVSDKCKEEVAKFKIERSKHINRDIALGNILLQLHRHRAANFTAP